MWASWPKSYCGQCHGRSFRGADGLWHRECLPVESNTPAFFRIVLAPCTGNKLRDAEGSPMKLDRKRLAQWADWGVVAVAVALPWSTSAVSILLAI